MDFRHDSRCLEFICSHPDASIYHYPGWLAALEAGYRQRCVSLSCEDNEGRFCAVLPLFHTNGLPFSFTGGRRLTAKL